MITLKQLAELSGLSVRTVGRALSGQGYVAPEKRELVRSLAEKYNYTPNLAARNLRLNNKKFVGIINGSSRLTANARKLSMLTRQLTDNGFWPMLGCVQDAQLCRSMLREWAALAEYVIVLQENRLPILDIIMQEAEKLPLEFIFVDCTARDIADAITVDRSGSVCNMFEELAGMNYRHFVYCGCLPSRMDGIKMAQDRGLDMQITFIEGKPEFDAGYALGDRIMQCRADGVFFDTDRMAMGFYRYAAENNIKIPDDIAAVGFDDEEFASLVTPALATLAHPRTKLADVAVKTIVEGKRFATEPIPMEFIRRASLHITAKK